MTTKNNNKKEQVCPYCTPNSGGCGGNHVEPTSYNDDRIKEETAKAYGGCTKCYGKGYATVRREWKGRGVREVDESPDICSCDRGKQIKKLLEEARREERERCIALVKEHDPQYGMFRDTASTYWGNTLLQALTPTQDKQE